MSEPLTPTQIVLHQQSKTLEVVFDNNERFVLPCEYLRVFSPSAEVRGHGADEMKLITGKSEVNIIKIEPVGHYGIKPVFDDGHATGIFTWKTLYELGRDYEKNWQYYLNRIKLEKK
jgi:DUF971 family protein